MSMEIVTVCFSTGCGGKASMRCPKCVPLGINDIGFICSQSCFSSEFSDNIEVNWPGSQFTGPLRPHKQSFRRIIPANIEKPDYVETSVSESERTAKGSSMLIVLSDEEKEKMRTVCALAREVLDEAVKVTKFGVTTDYIDKVVHEAYIARNCYPSPLNYYNFPRSCSTSTNEVICHGIPDFRPLQDGDTLNIDITVYYDGFHGVSVCVGSVNSRKLLEDLLFDNNMTDDDVEARSCRGPLVGIIYDTSNRGGVEQSNSGESGRHGLESGDCHADELAFCYVGRRRRTTAILPSRFGHYNVAISYEFDDNSLHVKSLSKWGKINMQNR